MNYIINEKEFIVREIEGETMMLNPLNGESHLLDRVATLFLDAIVKHDEKEQIIRYLMQFFCDVDEQTLSVDIDDFIQILLQKNILLKE